MMRSLFSGVSGLKTHQIKMDVIGNNIANVNTVGFKSQSIAFSELMLQTTQKASGPNETTGRAGTNAKQIGLGVTSGAISTAITTPGSTQTTGNAFDLRITGDSFFVVSDGSSNFFTRDGSFYVDAVGNLAMSSNGFNVMGWHPVTDPQTEETTIQQDDVKPLQILSAANMVSSPKATTQANISGILDRNDSNVTSTTGKAINLSFYDNLGYSYTAKFAIKDTDELGNYVLSLKDVMDSENNSVLDRFDATIFTGADSVGTSTRIVKASSVSLLDGFSLTGGQLFKLDENGAPTGAAIAQGTNEYANAFGYDTWAEFSQLCTFNGDGTVNQTIAQILSAATGPGPYNVDGYITNPGTAVTITYNQENGTMVGVNGSNTLKQFNLFLQPKDNTQENPFEVVAIDMQDSLNYNNNKTSTINALSGNSKGDGTGCAIGTMTGVTIQQDGKIYGAYDNGQTKLLGQIAVANFSNAMGLEKQGNNLYAATLNSGEFDGIGIDITSNGGSMSTGVLEMSNVDLSAEFTELITTQRGFQANSRIITVSDTLLEELVNLKR